MSVKLRELPPLCLLYAVGSLATGRLHLTRAHVGAVQQSESGARFKVFRNIRTRKVDPGLLEAY